MTAVVSEQLPPILKWHKFRGWIPLWLVAVSVLLALFSLLLLLIWKYYVPREEDELKLTSQSELSEGASAFTNISLDAAGGKSAENLSSRSLSRSLAIALWASFVLLAGAIYLDSVRNAQYGFLRTCIYLFSPVVIAFATFALEGLEIAYTDLRDKDSQQFSEKAAADVFRSIEDMGEKSFYEAREWAVLAFLILGTLLIEQPKYYVPFIAVVAEPHTRALLVMRVLLTVALTAFSLVWIAQSPAKFVARKNSVEFLGYIGRLPVTLLGAVWSILRGLGLQRPSDFANETALRFLSRCKAERNLLPSELSFFTDSLKKYGYAFLISDDVLTVNEDGSCKILARALFQIDMPRSSIKRRFEYEADFTRETLASFRDARPQNSRVWAFSSPLIGEKPAKDLITHWETLFYAKDPNLSLSPDFVIVPSDDFRHVIAHKPAKAKGSGVLSGLEASDRPLHRLEVELKFGDPLPSEPIQNESQRALLVLWEVEIHTGPKTFLLPDNWRDPAICYPYFKKHSHPCLACTVSISLPESEAGAWVFEETTEPNHYEVTYDDIVHRQETARFRLQHRTLPFTQAPVRVRGTMLRSLFVFFVDSTLPAAQYKANLYIRRQAPK